MDKPTSTVSQKVIKGRKRKATSTHVFLAQKADEDELENFPVSEMNVYAESTRLRTRQQQAKKKRLE